MEKSWNATVKCHFLGGSEYLNNGEVYSVKNGFLIDNEGGHYNGGEVHNLKELNDISRPAVSFELVPNLPRLCYVLGGGKKPLEEDEEFAYSGHVGLFRVRGETFEWNHDRNDWTSGNVWDLCQFINHPDKIIRSTQFSDSCIATMRELVKIGLPWLARDNDGNLFAFSEKPTMTGNYFDGTTEEDESICAGVPNAFFPQITPENSPFDCEAYLKSHE